MKKKNAEAHFMRNLALLIVGILVTPSLVFGDDQATDTERLVGTWKIVKTTVNDSGEISVDTNPPPGMYMFTNRFMSNLIVPEWEPRQVITSDSSDEDRLGAFSNFIADGGEYWVEGDVIQTHNFVALNPIGMRPEQKRGEGIRYQFRFEGDQLVIKMTNQAWAPNGSIKYLLERM